MSKTLFKISKYLPAAVFLCASLLGGMSGAQDFPKGMFDSKTRYDIYLHGDENDYTVISSVEILRVEEILGRRFLIIRPAEFTLNSADGFVAFDAVQAILPSRQIKVRSSEGKFRIKY